MTSINLQLQRGCDVTNFVLERDIVLLEASGSLFPANSSFSMTKDLGFLPQTGKSPCQKGDVNRLRHIMSSFLRLGLSSEKSIWYDVRQSEWINSDLQAYKNA